MEAYAAAVPGAGVDAWGTGVAPATLADFLCEVRANARSEQPQRRRRGARDA